MGGLSSLLVQDQVLSVTQIEQTLQRQVILGGDLPTILLELGMLEERVLVEYMSRVVGVSALPVDMYDNIDYSAADLISKKTAVECKAVPVRAGDQLLVAVTGPLAMESVQRLAEESKMAVTAQLVLEFRMALMMNQVYGVPLSGRMTTLQKKRVPDFSGVQRNVPEEKQAFERPVVESAPTADLEAEVDEKISIEATVVRSSDATTKLYQKETPPTQKLTIESGSVGHEDETRTLAQDNEIRKSGHDDAVRTVVGNEEPRPSMPLRMDALAARVRLTAPPESVVQEPEPVISAPAAQEPATTSEQTAAAPREEEPVPEVQVKKRSKRKLISFSEASALLDQAENRDDIIDTFFHFAHQAFDFTFLAVVHGDDASGRLAAYRGGEFNDADFVSIHLKEGGLFAKTFDRAEYQIGSMDDAPGLNVLNQLGLDVPLNAAVIPVVLKNRVIMLLYGDSGHHGIRANRVERIYEFAQLVARAFERLLLAKKYRKFSSIPPPAGDMTGGAVDAAIKVESENVSRLKRDFSGFMAAESAPPARPSVQVDSTSLEKNAESASTITSLDELATAYEQMVDRADEEASIDVDASTDDIGQTDDGSATGEPNVEASPTAPVAARETSTEGAATVANEVDTLRPKSPIPEIPADLENKVTVQASSVVSEELAGMAEVRERENVSSVTPPQKVSIAPSVNVRRELDADTTLKIHMESGSRMQNRDAERPPVKKVEPIRVSKTPPATTASVPPGARGTSPMRLETVAPGGSEKSVKEADTAAADTAVEAEKSTAEYRERPSVAPRPPIEHGRYMHVEKGYGKGEKITATETVRNYPVSRELHEQVKDATILVDEGSPIPLTDKALRSTAGYAELTREDLAPEETKIEPIPLQHPVSDATVSIEELEPLIDQLLKGQLTEALAEKILAGREGAIRLLIANFPGPLSCDRFQEMGKLPKIAYHGPLLRMLTMFGKQVIPFMLPLLDSFDSEIRFYTTFMFSELGGKDVLPQMVNRVFDNDRQIRMVAVDIIHQQQGTAEYNDAINSIAAVLVGSNTTLEKKRIAAEVFGQLHEPSAISHLAAMLGSVDGVLAERCQKALVKISFRDFGFSERRWLSWYDEQKYTHRLEWAIGAINDKNEDIRKMAIDEVRSSIGTRIEWPKPPYDFNQRRELQTRIQTWWDSGGRELFPITLS